MNEKGQFFFSISAGTFACTAVHSCTHACTQRVLKEKGAEEEIFFVGAAVSLGAIGLACFLLQDAPSKNSWIGLLFCATKFFCPLGRRWFCLVERLRVPPHTCSK